ncbi:MAG TPA: hypothetical protein VGM75_07010 [Pseudonocardiaceae bacterium]
MRSRIATFAVATATAAAATATFAGVALADPPASHTPALTDISGVGSDTTQFVMNDVTTGPGGWDSQIPAPANYVDSFDAVNPTTGVVGDTITTKPGCSFARPDGSSAGITSLINDQKSTVDGTADCVDYARSTRMRQGSDPASIGFLPFAQDSLKYATSHPTPSFPTVRATNAPQTLTAANLATIYSCGTTGTISHWTDFTGGTSTDAVQALIPQGGSGSGTRTFFESSIGVTDTTIVAGINSGCLLQVKANDPAPIRASADAIAPFSVPQFNSVGKDAGIQLDDFGFSADRILYNVVRLNASGALANQNLVPFFGDGTPTNTAFICTTAAQNIIDNTDGFSPITLPGHTCGVSE